MLENIYLNGSYSKLNPDWHLNDAAWKAGHIQRIIEKHKIYARNIAEIGCGAGGILCELSKNMDRHIFFSGYDISPQAIALALKNNRENIRFQLDDLLADGNTDFFDILLIIDVLEHVPDYLNFATKCRAKAIFKIYHIPLDISISSVLRKTCIHDRHQHGHLHYFSFESAIMTLEDTGHKVIDYCYTDAGSYYFQLDKTLKQAIINTPRWVTAFFNIPVAAKIFGRYSLLVLCQ